ncbi:MAG: helix-turn-helix transcriptional regulator [Elusimicrobiales bacterium]|nr:helix-turn-helix transcriptional regulator [Elusimicrobiales bacterium]
MITRKNMSPCPVGLLLQAIGNKWKVLIIRDLLTGTKRFGMLRKSVGCSQNVLTDNLRMLEEDRLIIRKAYAEVPPKVEYSLSGTGKTLKPVLDAMAAWGEKYRETIAS